MNDPRPGRPRNLGLELDRADAEGILAVAEASRTALRHGRPRTAPVRIIREALWFIWEHPRLPPPLVESKYPLSYPWSPGSQAVYANACGRRPAGGWGLVIEHLYPRERLVADLLSEESIDGGTAVTILTSRLMAAVVTRDEDRLLPARGDSSDTWTSYETDPWRRYRSSAVRLDRFAPISDRVRSGPGRLS